MLSEDEVKKLPPTAKEARLLGLKYYFTGKPCPQGHTVERQTSSQSCVQCNRERRRRDRIKQREREEVYRSNQRKRLRKKYSESETFRNQIRQQSFQRRYGISLEEYNSLLSEQGSKCKICKAHETQLKRKLAVDHSHTTGRVRGLLCSECNLMLGKFNDDVVLLKTASKYLRSDKDYRLPEFRGKQ